MAAIHPRPAGRLVPRWLFPGARERTLATAATAATLVPRALVEFSFAIGRPCLGRCRCGRQTEDTGRQPNFRFLRAWCGPWFRRNVLSLRLRLWLVVMLVLLVGNRMRLGLWMRHSVRLALMALVARLLISAFVGLIAARTIEILALAVLPVLIVAVVEAALLSVLLLLLEARVQHAVIVIGMLEVVFRKHAVTGGTRIPCEREILFHELLRVAAHAPVAAIIIGISAAAAAAAHGPRLAAVSATLTIFHVVWFVHQLSKPFEHNSPDKTFCEWRSISATTARLDFGGGSLAVARPPQPAKTQSRSLNRGPLPSGPSRQDFAVRPRWYQLGGLFQLFFLPP